MWERTSGGNLLIGCNVFRKEDMHLRISCALVSILAICGVYKVRTLHHNTRQRTQGSLTSDSSRATDTPGEACSHAHSRPSFSFKARRRSGTERSRAASGGMVVVADQSVSGSRRYQIRRVWQLREIIPVRQFILYVVLGRGYALSTSQNPYRMQRKANDSKCNNWPPIVFPACEARSQSNGSLQKGHRSK